MRRVAVVVGLTMRLLLPDLIVVPKTGHAQDVKALLNQFNKDIRQVQRDMFSGKDEKSIAALEGLQGLLKQIETLDPSHPQLKTSQNKLIEDLGQGLPAVHAHRGVQRGQTGAPLYRCSRGRKPLCARGQHQIGSMNP